MKSIFVATANKGKQAEIVKYAAQYGKDIQLRFPDADNALMVNESGKTFEENALLKAEAYQRALGDPATIFVGDDSGIKIPALNNEPGVFTRRWAGHEMSDAEILAYCLDKMSGLHGEDRTANFETVLAVVGESNVPQYYRGTMRGHILETPLAATPVDGFPFRSIFWVDEIDRPISEVHSLPAAARGGFLTHREQAFKQLFNSLSA